MLLVPTIVGILMAVVFIASLQVRDRAEKDRQARGSRDQQYLKKMEARARARLLSRLAASLRPGTFVEAGAKYGRLVKVEDDSGLYVFVEDMDGEVHVVGNPTDLRELSLLEVLALESNR